MIAVKEWFQMNVVILLRSIMWVVEEQTLTVCQPTDNGEDGL